MRKIINSYGKFVVVVAVILCATDFVEFILFKIGLQLCVHHDIVQTGATHA